jgi:hypothetical protein
VRKDDDLVALIGEGLARGGIVPRGGDVFVLTQKIVSKAEGRMNEKPDRSAQMRIVVRLRFGVTEPHQTAAISARDGKPRTRLDVSQQGATSFSSCRFSSLPSSLS